MYYIAFVFLAGCVFVLSTVCRPTQVRSIIFFRPTPFISRFIYKIILTPSMNIIYIDIVNGQLTNIGILFDH